MMNDLEGMRPLERGFEFAIEVLSAVLDIIEEGYNNEDLDQIDKGYRLFELYTGRLSDISERMEKVLKANMLVIQHRWEKTNGLDH